MTIPEKHRIRIKYTPFDYNETGLTADIARKPHTATANVAVE
jgi:hypothetical protein